VGERPGHQMPNNTVSDGCYVCEYITSSKTCI